MDTRYTFFIFVLLLNSIALCADRSATQPMMRESLCMQHKSIQGKTDSYKRDKMLFQSGSASSFGATMFALWITSNIIRDKESQKGDAMMVGAVSIANFIAFIACVKALYNLNQQGSVTQNTANTINESNTKN